MSACCPADVKAIHSIMGGTVTSTYLDLTGAAPVIIDQATYDALVKVKCPENVVDTESACIQPVGNTDASLVVQGMVCIPKTITYDAAGAPTIAVGTVTIHDATGADITATHEVVACPEPVVCEVESCVV